MIQESDIFLSHNSSDKPAIREIKRLLAQSRVTLVRTEYDLDCWANHFTNGNLMAFALPKLIFGCAYLQQWDFQRAVRWLDQAVANLYEAGSQGDLPHGLLARSALYRDTRNPNYDFARARQDLQEVYDIAEPSGMRLHLTDYHLEMALLLIAEKGNPPRSPFVKGGNQESSVPEVPSLEKGAKGDFSARACGEGGETDRRNRLQSAPARTARIAENNS